MLTTRLRNVTVTYLWDFGGLLGGNIDPPFSWYGGGSGGGAWTGNPPWGGGLGGRSQTRGGDSDSSSRSGNLGGSGGGGSNRGSVPSGTSFISKGTGSSPVKKD